MYVFDVERQEVTRKLKQYGWKTALAWSADGKHLAVGDRRRIAVWDVDAGEVAASCEGPNSMILDITWNGPQNRIAALSQDGQISLWDSRSWEYCGKFSVHQRSPYAIRWSPDGQRLVSTARYGRIVFKDLGEP